MPTNFWMFFITALIPLLVGSVWYGPIFGKKWMKVNGFTEESLQGANMAVIFILSYLLSVIFSFALSGMVIHQSSVFQMMMPDVMEAGSAAQNTFDELMATYGEYHRGWKHGLLHGAIFSVFAILPLIAINALFERRGASYIFIHFGYWLVCSMLIGAVLCETLKF